jgi:hypothetical protein
MVANVFADRVRDTSTSGGTGTFTLSGTAPINYRTFGAVCTTGDLVPYTIVNRVLGEWETGIGRYGGSNTLIRQGGDSSTPTPTNLARVMSSSNAGSLVPFSGSGTQTKDVVLSMNARMQRVDLPSVTDFGADPTGAVDSSNAFNAAWQANGCIYAPRGKYLWASPITMPSTQDVGLIGDGAWSGLDVTGASWTAAMGGTLIVANYTTGSCLTVPGVQGVRLKGFTLTRSTIATTGYGIDAMTNIPTFAYFDDLHLMHHNIGIGMAGWDTWSVLQNSVSEQNATHGFYVNGQLQLSNLFAWGNTGGSAFYVDDGGFGPASSGNWRGLQCAGTHAGYGLRVNGVGSAHRIEGLRISDSFFGGATSGNVSIDSYATAPHTFTNVYCEAAPSGVDCWTFSANNPTINMVNCSGTGSGAFNALNTAAPQTNVMGGYFQGTGSGNGIFVSASSKKLTVMGIHATGFATGVNAQSCTGLAIHGCNLTAGNTAAINSTGSTSPSTVGNY